MFAWLKLLLSGLPYILAYKSKNLGQILALKVSWSTYMQVIILVNNVCRAP